MCIVWAEHSLNSFVGGITLDNSPNYDYMFGRLPDRATLASAYVPIQVSSEPYYEPQTAIARGTLFPGLDLPFLGMVNEKLPATPLGELMAIDFVADELSLYLDTHKDDTQAFEQYQSVLSLSREAHKRYVETCGPLTKNDMLGMKRYAWLNSPWPWEQRTEREA